MPLDAHQAVRESIQTMLKFLNEVGVPGAGLAEEAVQKVAAYLDEQRAWDALQGALARAEQAFREDARRRGWDDLADAILQLPIHNLPAFEAALRDALEMRDPARLEAHLRESLAALPGGDDPHLAARAARRYAEHILDALWTVPAFRTAVRDVLLKGNARAIAHLQTRMDALQAQLQALPGRVWDEKACRDHQAAWRKIHLPAPKPPPEPGTPFQFHELKAAYRLVPFTGREHHALRDDLVEWALGLGERPGRTGLRWLHGPGGAGKTRLLVEVAHILREQGWQVGFLPREAWDQGAIAHWARPDGPALLVADYAEMHPPEQVTALLDAVVATAEERRHPLALVFLTRQGPTPGATQAPANLLAKHLQEWATRGVAPLRAELVQEALSTHRGLPTLEENDRQDLFRAAVERFRRRLNVPEGVPAVDYTPEALPRRPLALILLALLAAQGRRVAQSADEQTVYAAAWA